MINSNENKWIGYDRTAQLPSDPAVWHLGTSVQIQAGGRPVMELEELSEAGIQCIELAWRHDEFDMLEQRNQQYIEKLIMDSEEMNIEIWSLHLPYGPEWDVSILDSKKKEQVISNHLNLMRKASQWGIRQVVLHPSWEPILPIERSERLHRCKQSLALLSAEGKQLGVRLAVECLPRTCLGNSSEEIAFLLESNDLLGVCCDVNHLLLEAPEQFIRKLGSRIITVHMSDNDGKDERHWLPGKGIICWNEVISALQEHGYRGPFMFEARPVVPSQLASCWKEILSDYTMRSRE